MSEKKPSAPAKYLGAWDDFWRNEGASGGCLPSAMAQVDEAQAALWQAFAERLPRRAKTLDIATGDGRVMGHMLSARPDIRPLGVDLASHLPPPPKGCKVKPGVAMETLPFADDLFAGVTSQFGLEYGDIDAALAEMARVLESGGRLGLLVHRQDGPILAHNIARRTGLLWALDEKGLIAKARAGLSLRAMGVVVPPALTSLTDEAIARHGHGSAAWELCAAVVQTLRGGADIPVSHVSDTLAILDAKAHNEIGRIDALEQACAAVADIDRLKDRVEKAGFAIDGCELVATRNDSNAFANILLARLA